MARDQIDMTPIETRDELVAWFEAGCKPKAQFRVGTEHEKFVFTVNEHRPVPYDGARSIHALLVGMDDLLGWEPIMEGENIIGMFDVTGGGAISLEPGGQFELSGAPVETVHQTASELMAHLAQVREVAKPLGIGFLGLGMTPNWKRSDMPMMPKGRYKIMTGLHAQGRQVRPRHDVPHLHRAGEPRLLIRSRHGEEAARVARPAAGGDRAVCQFAVHRRQAERLSLLPLADLDRHRQPRAGMLPFVFEQGMGFERYVDYALDVPMYFVKRGDKYIDVSGKSFRDFFAGKLDALPGERPTISDWANHLSTIFPEVRLKRFLEMRGADGGPWRRLPSLTAYWVGLLYDDDALDACWQMIKDWSAAERQKLRDDVPRLGFKAEIGNRNVLTLAQETLRLCAKGLQRRHKLDRNGRDETRYLRPLEESIARGITPAEELLEKYFNEWNNSVEPIFDEYAY